MIAQTSPIREALLRSPKLARSTKPRMTSYIRNRPTKKQRAAMCMPHVTELFYGGAAGGGKSEWLLMEALQYVDIPDYRAIIFRRSLADASRQGSIMFRAHDWLASTDARWHGKGNCWVFPSGATLGFAGLSKRGDEEKIQGAEFSFMGFDELTQFDSWQFEYAINSRLRKPGCDLHEDHPDADCHVCQKYSHTRLFPLRVRTAANPGGRSHLYVKNRYRIEKVPGMISPDGLPLYAGRFIKGEYDETGEWIPARPHIPAFIHDNPFLNQKRYMKQLRQMTDPVTRAQLLSGNWGITQDGRFKRAWVKRWRYSGETHIQLDNGGVFDLSRCYQFLMVDPAGTKDDAPGRTELGRKQGSWTVISRWLVTPAQDLLLVHVRRFQQEMPEIIDEIKHEIAQSRGMVRFCGMEYTVQSQYLYQDAQRKGLPMRQFKTMGKDKISRSYDASNRMKEGKILLPDPGPVWLGTYEDELFTWTGAPEETDDQVDVTSYAGIYITSDSLGATTSLPTTW